MGKKSLFISLICGICVVVGLGVFSLVTIFSPAKKNTNQGEQVFDQKLNQGNNKGSEEDPYYLSDSTSFVQLLNDNGSKEKPKRIAKMSNKPVMVAAMTEKVDEEGKVVLGEDGKPVMVAVMTEKVDEEGKVVLGEDGKPVMVPVMTEKLDENGEIVYDYERDANGYVVYDDIEDDEGNKVMEPYHFKLYNDIDFAEVTDFYGIFNDGKAFSGVIDGDGHSVKNVTIHVTKENIGKYLFTISQSDKSYIHIGIFGDLSDAVIKNITFENVTVIVDNDVYEYIDKKLWDEHTTSIVEFTIGTVAGCVENSEVQANVSAVVDADAYSVYLDNENKGKNGLGGVFGYANGLTFSNLENGYTNVKIVADSGSKNYYLGGVVGYSFNSTIKEVNANVKVSASGSVSSNGDKLYIGGVVGYLAKTDVLNSVVDVDVRQLEGESRVTLEGVTGIKDSLYNWVGGITAKLCLSREKKEDGTVEVQNSNIENVKLTSYVDMDCLYGGVTYNMTRATKDNGNYSDIRLNLTNNTLLSTAYTLKAYGVGYYLVNTKIDYTADYIKTKVTSQSGDVDCNIMLAGETKLKPIPEEEFFPVAIISANSGNAKDVDFLVAKLLVLVSYKNFEKIPSVESNYYKYNLYGLFGIVDSEKR